MENAVKKENVLKNRNFMLVFLGALVSEMGSTLYSFAVSFYILEVSGNNAFLQGLYLAVCGVTFVLVTPFGGVLSDRLNKVRIMYICDYVKGACIIAATLLMTVYSSAGAHIAILFVIGFSNNVIGGFFSPASGALLPSIVDENQLQQANSYFSLKSSFISILGIVAAGILYAALPVNTLFLVVGICFILSGVSEIFIRITHIPSTEKISVKLIFKDMGDGFVYVKNQKALLILTLSILFLNCFLSPVAANFMPYFLMTDLASAPSYLFDGILTPELWSSVLNVLFSITSIAASVILSAKAQEEKCGKKVAWRIGLIAVIMIVLTAAYNIFVQIRHEVNPFLITFAITWMLLGIIIMFINIPINTAMMKMVDKDKLGKVTSILTTLSQGLSPLALLLAGTVLQQWGSSALLTVCAAGFAVTALIMLCNKHVKEF